MAAKTETEALIGERARDNTSLLNKWILLAIFLFFTMGLGALVGASTPPGEWYANLDKPFFNPPNWLFGPVWTLLYAMVAIAGWRTWLKGYKGLAMQIWFGQFALNLTWSPIFFGLQQKGLALFVIAGMIGLTTVFVRLTWKPDRNTALLMLPYLAWISFAALLNATLWLMN
ncbi:MAG: TspO/MBR family protein [Pseudomonadota bacterium]